MSARRYALLAAFALFIAFIAANVTANSWFRSWRLDLTENQLYSLSPGTQQTLDELSEPVQINLYYSREAARSIPQIQTYATRVRELLQAYAARSHGRVRFTEVNVEAFSDEEEDAIEAGIEAIRPHQGADPIYFGLTGANAIDDRRAIPQLDPQREPFLEYEITRLIYELEHPDRTRVALITSLPIDPSAVGQQAIPGMPGQSVFATEMGRMLDVVKLAPDFTTIPDVDVLAIIHPGALSDEQLFAIDQFILRRGRAFIALDPAALVADQGATGFDPFNPVSAAPTSSVGVLAPLLTRWGVTMPPAVVADAEGALPVPTQDPQTGQQSVAPQPLLFRTPAETGLDRDDMMTGYLSRGVNFGLAGVITYAERDGVTVEQLIRTSGQTMRMSSEQALMLPSPYDVARMWSQGGGRIENIAIRLSGNVETAFPEGRPAAEPVAPVEGEAAPATAPGGAPAQPPADEQVLTRSAAPAEIVIVSDVDFLSDDFYIDPNSGGSAADNASFALNSIDVLGGSSALVSLRSRARADRPMQLVADLERDAERRIQTRTEELQAELQDTESRLAELQARGRGSGFFAGDLGAELTPEENAEIERFRTQVVQVRSELRTTERTLRGDINRLETLVVFINVWLAPLLIAGAGLFLFWRRQRRGSARR